MTQPVDKNFIALAERMADAAGDILRRHYRAPIDVERKSDASPVTIADREVETALRALIESHYPDHGIIGEEFGNVRGDSPFQWVLDPIDGTRSFIAGYPLFTTLIALAHEGTPILGLIDQPILRERWLGTCHPGAGRDPLSRVRGGKALTLANAVLSTTSTDYFTPTQTQQFLKLKSQASSIILGGDAYAYAMLAEDRIDIVADAGMKPYDFCALKCVVENAGGTITDWQGNPLTIHSDGNVLAAATKELHAMALNFLLPSA